MKSQSTQYSWTVLRRDGWKLVFNTDKQVIELLLKADNRIASFLNGYITLSQMSLKHF